MKIENIDLFKDESFFLELKKTVLAKKQSVKMFKQENVLSFENEFDQLPSLLARNNDFGNDWVKVGGAQELDPQLFKQLLDFAEKLKPWRKGPYEFFGIKIDSEWRSNLKWDRLKNKITKLKGKKILDVGSSSGYYMFRMLDQSPELILGIEPFMRYFFQYKLLERYLSFKNLMSLPLRLEELPLMENYFDVIFCMGILYHRKSPLDTLKNLYKKLNQGGELILETLVVDRQDDYILSPEKTYAKMNNVYFIPSVHVLKRWMNISGFKMIEEISLDQTTSKEQRKTEWIHTQSLDTFLDPFDSSKTVESYPAPLRVIITAKKE